MNNPWLYIVLLSAIAFFIARKAIDTVAAFIWGGPVLQGYLGTARTLNAHVVRPRAHLTIGLGIVSCFVLTTSFMVVRIPAAAKYGPLIACGIFLVMDVAERLKDAQTVWKSGHLSAEAEYLRAAKFAFIATFLFALPMASIYAFAPGVQTKAGGLVVNLLGNLVGTTAESVLWWAGVLVLGRAIIMIGAYLNRHFEG